MRKFYNREEEEFHVKNLQQWEDLHKKLFKDSIPESKVWQSPIQIAEVLNTIGSYANGNHMFCPGSGGLDIEGAKVYAGDKSCIEIDCGLTYILRPKSLSFESFGKELEWNYFRLETEPQKPISFDEGNENDYDNEQVVEEQSGQFRNDDSDDFLGKGERRVIRVIKGSYVVFAKRSVYNLDNSTYDGRHDKMTAVEFRNYISKNAR